MLLAIEEDVQSGRVKVLELEPVWQLAEHGTSLEIKRVDVQNLITFMKYYFFILLVFLMIFSACETAESDNTDPLKQVSQNGEKPDSVIIAEVNNYIKFVFLL